MARCNGTVLQEDPPTQEGYKKNKIKKKRHWFNCMMTAWHDSRSVTKQRIQKMVLNTRIEPNSIRIQISWHMNSGQHQGKVISGKTSERELVHTSCSQTPGNDPRTMCRKWEEEEGRRAQAAADRVGWIGHISAISDIFFFPCQINYLPLGRFSSVIAATWARFSHLYYLRYVYFIPHYFYFAEAASGGRRSLSTGRWFIRWNGCLWFYH